MNSVSHIAIIGAGIAGLSCATALQHAGLNVSVFDKSRGPGGRMSTRRGTGDGDAAWQCDHGAQYFTARDPGFQIEVARWCKAAVAALWTPRLSTLKLETLNGAHEQSAEQKQRFVGLPRMTAPAHFLAEALALTVQFSVKELSRDADGWRLLSAESGLSTPVFGAVLLAIPAPQAASLLSQIAPPFAAIAANTEMRGSWTLMLQFAAAVSLPFDAAFVDNKVLGWIARDSSKPGRTGLESWVLQATPEWSEAHIEDDASSVAATLLAAFTQLGGPDPQTWAAHRWRYADTESSPQIGYAWDAEIGIGMCGDWLNGGKVEGAWLSGQQLARQVLTSI